MLLDRRGDNVIANSKGIPIKYLYHGTISKFVPSILDKGLSPVEINMWKASIHKFFSDYRPAEEDPKGWVYLTPSLAVARGFARTKAEYFRAKPGQEFKLHSIYSDEKGISVDATKDSTAPWYPDAEPAVVRIAATPDLLAKLQPDIKAPDGFMITGTIEPSIITPMVERTHHVQPTL